MIKEYEARNNIVNDGFWTVSFHVDFRDDFMKFRDYVFKSTGYKSGKTMLSMEHMRLFYGDFFIEWNRPTDWEIYVQGNENLQKWRHNLSRRAAQKAMRTALKNSKPLRDKSWRADERRRSKQRMPGR